MKVCLWLMADIRSSAFDVRLLDETGPFRCTAITSFRHKGAAKTIVLVVTSVATDLAEVQSGSCQIQTRAVVDSR